MDLPDVERFIFPNINKEFSGNLQKGKAELYSEREKQREENAKELNEKIQTDICTSPKF